MRVLILAQEAADGRDDASAEARPGKVLRALASSVAHLRELLAMGERPVDMRSKEVGPPRFDDKALRFRDG